MGGRGVSYGENDDNDNHYGDVCVYSYNGRALRISMGDVAAAPPY